MKSKTLSLAVLMATSALVAPWAVMAQDQGVAQSDATPAETPVESTDSAEEPITEVVVRGRNVPNTMRRTAEVTSILTGEDLKRTGDDSAAAALTRVTGLSLVEGRFIYVRGLGERYSSALLNGSPLPSPEPLQRVVPLDLFPSSILARVSVQKTHSAEFWGEFGGGVVDLKTVTTPAEPFLSLSIGTGGNSETVGKDAFTHYGSDTDFTGFDDGTRKLPHRLRTALGTGLRVNAVNFPADIKRIAQDFVNAPLNLVQETGGLPANFSFNIVGGRSFDVAEGQLGVIGLVDFSNSWRVKDGIQQSSDINNNKLVLADDYDYSTSENYVSVNGLLGLGYRFDKHAFQWTNLFIRNTTKRTQVREGFDFSNSEIRRRDQTGWYARQLVSTQLTGTHDLIDKLTLNWRASYAKTQRDVPYEKEIIYGVGIGNRWYHDTSRYQNRTDFSILEDVVKSAGASLTYDISLGEGRDGQITGGFDILENTREAESRQFRFTAGTAGVPVPTQYSRVDFLLSDFNIGSNYLTLSDVTPGSGAAAYDGGLFVTAAYLKADIEVIPLVRVAGGLRFESAKQRITPLNLYASDGVAGKVVPLKEDYVLPSATATWNFADDMQLRIGASKTIGRPQFRELAPQVYLDPEQDRLFVGNPYLKDTELTNFDARYEWYYDAGQYLTAGFFYKDLDKPVEAVILDTGSGQGQQTYINAPKATLYGVEFDFKGVYDTPEFGQISQADFFQNKRWTVSANYTLTDSEVEAKAGDVVFTSANLGAPTPATLYITDGARLQGQSEHVANLQFGWDDIDAKSQATLLLTYVSERVSARGKPGFPDYIQEPGTMLDFTYRKGFDAFGRELNFGVEVRNLLGTEYQEYQERETKVFINKYDLGQSVSFSLSTSF